MLNVNFEFRKGIFFLRLIGNLNKENYQKIEKETKESKSNLVICDKFNIFKRLLNNNFPNIHDELEVL